ncbi:hypothetical protein N7501_009725 [Penicillium viridicatum]|nr:hypothetical protein N7501_009725 [Penicillium viridicatum]
MGSAEVYIILLTKSRGVKIAGIELSCQIGTAEIDAATLKLIHGVPKQGVYLKTLKGAIYRESCYACLDHPSYSDSAKVLLRNVLTNQSNFFGKVEQGELKILVNAANKTAYHNLESFKRI